MFVIKILAGNENTYPAQIGQKRSIEIKTDIFLKSYPSSHSQISR